MVANLGAWFITGEFQYFKNETDALAWLEV